MPTLTWAEIFAPQLAWWKHILSRPDKDPEDIKREMLFPKPPKEKLHSPPITALGSIPSDGSPDTLPKDYTPRAPPETDPPSFNFSGEPITSGRMSGNPSLDPDVVPKRRPQCYDEQQDLLDCVWKSQCILQTRGHVKACVYGSECAMYLAGFKACQAEMFNHSGQWLHRRYQARTGAERRPYDREARTAVLDALTSAD